MTPSATTPADAPHTHADSLVTNADVKLIRLKETFVAASRAWFAPAGPPVSLWKAYPLLPSERQSRDSPSRRRRISGVQCRPTLGSVPDLRRQDARARARDDHRADDCGCDDSGRARRLRHRADG